MTAVGATDLANKCLDFCQALSSQGTAFKFSLAMGSDFSFSLDTRVLASDTQAKIPPKKKPSPSTLRRNARRREVFLSKKRNPAPSSPARLLQHPPDLPTPEKERLPDANADLQLTPAHGIGRDDFASPPSPSTPPSPSEPGGVSSPSEPSPSPDSLSVVCDLFLPWQLGIGECGKTFDCELDLRSHVHEVHRMCPNHCKGFQYLTPCPWSKCQSS